MRTLLLALITFPPWPEMKAQAGQRWQTDKMCRRGG